MAQYALAREFGFEIIKAALEFLREHDANETQREYIRAHRECIE